SARRVRYSRWRATKTTRTCSISRTSGMRCGPRPGSRSRDSVLRKATFQAAVLAIVALATTASAIAHHSFAAEFDENKPVKFTGKVTEMRWSNPHGWIYLDVTGADGKVVNWACELAAVNSLYRRGWRKEDLVTGTMLTVE